MLQHFLPSFLGVLGDNARTFFTPCIPRTVREENGVVGLVVVTAICFGVNYAIEPFPMYDLVRLISCTTYSYYACSTCCMNVLLTSTNREAAAPSSTAGSRTVVVQAVILPPGACDRVRV